MKNKDKIVFFLVPAGIRATRGGSRQRCAGSRLCEVPSTFNSHIFFCLASSRMLKSKELVFLQSWQENKTCEHIKKVKIVHKKKVVVLFHLVLSTTL